MSRQLWYLTRASGIVATLLVVAALLWGFLFSARETGRRLRPAWWLDLHNWLGGLALIFTGVHIAASFLDSSSGIGLAQIFLPRSDGLRGWSIAWGVIATYLLAAVVFTTWPRRLSNRRWWRVLHLSSVLATALALLHTYQAGSDATQFWFRLGLVGALAVATYGLAIRLVNLGLKLAGRGASKGRSPGGARFSQRALSSRSAPTKSSPLS